jgi:oligogalacturonide lyase
MSVARLTDPSVSSILPPAANNPISQRTAFLLYGSDASGSWQAYHMDLKRGESKQLTAAEELEPSSLTLLKGDKSLYYWANGRLMTGPLESGGARQVYRVSPGFDAGRGIHVSSDGMYLALIEKRSATHRLRLLPSNLQPATLVEVEDEMRDPLIRPRRASVLYRRGGALYLATFDGKQNYRLRVAEGTVAQATWSPDGHSVLYLSVGGTGRLNTIREFVPDTNEDRLVSETTQFVNFACNGNASVFAGASGSKASPYILLLVRAVKRELTLCEHRASDPLMAAPVFSPNSQHVFFTSDLHGKPAIYRIDVAKLVAETAQSEIKGK